MKKKINRLLIVSLLCTSMLCGCSKTEEETSKECVEAFLDAYQQQDTSYAEYLENVEENSTVEFKDFQAVLAEKLEYEIESVEIEEDYNTVHVRISTVDCGKILKELLENEDGQQTKEEILEELTQKLQETSAPRCEYETYLRVTKENEVEMSLSLYNALLGGYYDCISELETQKTQDAEAELKSLAESHGIVSAWEYADYDGNGTKEAFAVITEENGNIEENGCGSIEEVLFISSEGKVVLMDEDLMWTLYTRDENNIRYVDGKGFFWADMGAGGSGWLTLLYSVKDDVPYQLQLSENIQGFYEQDGIFYTTENEFLPEGGHLYPNVELIYDSDAQEFVKGERIEIGNEE